MTNTTAASSSAAATSHSTTSDTSSSTRRSYRRAYWAAAISMVVAPGMVLLSLVVPDLQFFFVSWIFAFILGIAMWHILCRRADVVAMGEKRATSSSRYEDSARAATVSATATTTATTTTAPVMATDATVAVITFADVFSPVVWTIVTDGLTTRRGHRRLPPIQTAANGVTQRQ